MFSCIIKTTDNYFRHGLFILLKEALMDCHVNANATLADDADWHTKWYLLMPTRPIVIGHWNKPIRLTRINKVAHLAFSLFSGQRGHFYR